MDDVEQYIQNLPAVDKAVIVVDDFCPICLVSFDDCYTEAEDATSGVSKLECGHLFCRRDLTEWIRGMHGTCPSCRQQFLDIKPASESDDESSDGGEYIPMDDDDDDDMSVYNEGFTSEPDELDYSAEHYSDIYMDDSSSYWDLSDEEGEEDEDDIIHESEVQVIEEQRIAIDVSTNSESSDEIPSDDLLQPEPK